MFTYAAIAAGLAFAAAVQPGPFQAYLLSRIAAVGWRRTLPAALAPVISDGPIAALALLVLGNLSPALQGALRLAGGVFMVFLAWRTFAAWRRNTAAEPASTGKTPRTILEATLVNALNPNPYLGWVLILGPLVVGAWNESPHLGVTVVVSFYVTMVATLAATIVLLGSTMRLGARFQRSLMLVSAVLLAGIGAYQLVLGFGLAS